MTGPLTGYRVVDFGHQIAGPLVGMMLADLGADVIKIFRKGLDGSETRLAAALDRGKRCVALDLKSPDGLLQARELVWTSDVVIENFRPDVMDRLGLGVAEMRKSNPRLIYLSLPGFSSNDAARRALPGWEGVILAAAGVFRDRGTNHRLRGLGPSYVAMPLASAYAAALGTAAVLTSLFARRNTGRGDRVEVPLFSAIVEALSYNSLAVQGLPDRYREYRERELRRKIETSEPLDFTYAQLAEVLDPLYGPNLCGDGRYYYLAASGNRVLTERALRAMGIWDALIAGGLPVGNPYRDMPNLGAADGGTIHGYQTLSTEWFEKIKTAVRSCFLQKSSFEWEAIFVEASVPGAAVRTSDEWLEDGHAVASGLIASVEDPVVGNCSVPGPLFWLPSETAVKIRAREVLSEVPSWHALPNDDRAGVFSGSALALAGITILDLTAVIAGPTIGSTLQRFGAEVIKVDPVAPAFDPLITVLLSFVGGRGKKSVLLNLKSQDGFAAFADLVRRADVVTYNGTQEQLERLGISFAALKSINDKIVLCQLSAFGGPLGGPRSSHFGYDETLQATSGIMCRSGGSTTTPEEHAYYGTVDVVTGYLGAAAVVAALLVRESSGKAAWAATSLAAGAHLIQAPFLFDVAGTSLRSEAIGPNAVGEDAFHRIYAVEGGWIFLAVHQETQGKVFDAICREQESADAVADPEKAMATAFRARPFDYWQNLLGEFDAGFHKLETMQDIRALNLVNESALVERDLHRPVLFLHHETHPSGLMVDVAAPVAIQLRGGHIQLPSGLAKAGSDTRSILKSIGRSVTDIDQLLANAAAAESWAGHKSFLPH